MMDFNDPKTKYVSTTNIYKSEAHKKATKAYMRDILEMREKASITISLDRDPVTLSEVYKLCNVGAKMQMLATAVQLQHAKDQEMIAQGFMDKGMKEFLGRIAVPAIVAVVAIVAMYFYLKH